MGFNFANKHERLAKPKHKIFVLGITGLTNFWGGNVKANSLASKQKFSAGVFCFFLTSKRKKPVPSGQKTYSINMRIQFLVSKMIF